MVGTCSSLHSNGKVKQKKKQQTGFSLASGNLSGGHGLLQNPFNAFHQPREATNEEGSGGAGESLGTL